MNPCDLIHVDVTAGSSKVLGKCWLHSQLLVTVAEQPQPAWQSIWMLEALQDAPPLDVVIHTLGRLQETSIQKHVTVTPSSGTRTYATRTTLTISSKQVPRHCKVLNPGKQMLMTYDHPHWQDFRAQGRLRLARAFQELPTSVDCVCQSFSGPAGRAIRNGLSCFEQIWFW